MHLPFTWGLFAVAVLALSAQLVINARTRAQARRNARALRSRTRIATRLNASTPSIITRGLGSAAPTARSSHLRLLSAAEETGK